MRSRFSMCFTPYGETCGARSWQGVPGRSGRGGALIVKEVVDRPRWKYWAIMAQETLSVTLFGITKGDRPHFESPEIYREAIVDAGFSIVEERPLSSANWISHYLFVARKI